MPAHHFLWCPCLINANARIYDSTLGRFISADSIVPDRYDGQSYNCYAYVENRPLSATDPTGHDDVLQRIENVIITGDDCGENCVELTGFDVVEAFQSDELSWNERAYGIVWRAAANPGATPPSLAQITTALRLVESGTSKGADQSKNDKRNSKARHEISTTARNADGQDTGADKVANGDDGKTSGQPKQVCQSVGYMACAPMSPDRASATNVSTRLCVSQPKLLLLLRGRPQMCPVVQRFATGLFQLPLDFPNGFVLLFQ